MSASARWYLPLVAAVGTGCIASAAPNPEDFVSGVVEGQVTRGDGSPVGGPLVLVSLLSAPQGGQVFLLAQTQLLATDQGRFQATFLVEADPQTATTAIHVERPIASGLRSLDTTGIAVNLGRPFPPRDTTFVQLTLRPQ